MFEVGIFHNGRTTLPFVDHDGQTVPSGSLTDLQEAQARVLQEQVRLAVLAEELGYHYWFQSEHHFDTEGMEYSPNPLISAAAIAGATRRIRLGQCANILPWHNPVRLAEMAAMVDVLSGGRLEMGVGRGYQPRETEVLGWPMGTIQDNEKNRAYYEEALDVLLKCWTEDSFSHHGQFFSVPPTYTKWNHPQTIANLSQPGKGVSVRDVIDFGPDDSLYQPASGIMSGTVTLRQLTVLPHPLQKPHPQLWEPVVSPRSVAFIARNGINGVSLAEPMEYLRGNVDRYMEEAAAAGWPDRLGRGEFKRGWDSERRRGYIVGRFLYVLDDDIGDEGNVRRAISAWLDRYPPFMAGGALVQPGEDLLKSGLWIVGTRQEIIDRLLWAKETVGYEDFNFLVAFEALCSSYEENVDQMRCFAEDIMPVLAKECGGSVTLPEVGIDYRADALSAVR